ncbi:hypothetical protein N8I77_007200 [Diaporthe amygdali]|uniref:Methyltransferase type 11 domain-containing protein n=1 Tax=Phomopsis amygdali TaxID=1214568 RepID=A0AAD9SDX5_PHOAM|nr:hypothetical protein N8I77_007200 [Diaporthe amygdali]
MGSNGQVFAQDDDFWNNYLKGRPQVPENFFTRIFDYHRAHGGRFGAAHDVGAGNGPYAKTLRSRFNRVIVSDIVAQNIELARQRLRGADGFIFRTAKLQDAEDIEPGSVDMVFATNVLHFAHPQDEAMAALSRQLRQGGTLAIALFGPARFHDTQLQDLWERISHEGGRQLLREIGDAAAQEATIQVMARTQGTYNVAPLNRELFEAGAQRIHLNMRSGGIQGMLPPEEAHRDKQPNYTGPDDVETYEDDEGWSFVTDLAGVKAHFATFPFVSKFPDALAELYQELDDLLAGGKSVKGYYPVKIILSTRR